MRILVVENDERIADALAEALIDQHYVVYAMQARLSITWINS